MSRVQVGWWGQRSQSPNPEVQGAEQALGQAAHSLSFSRLCLQFRGFGFTGQALGISTY